MAHTHTEKFKKIKIHILVGKAKIKAREAKIEFYVVEKQKQTNQKYK
jgi:hypothetical protein